jgi:DNA-binding response OmpR family regulator
MSNSEKSVPKIVIVEDDKDLNNLLKFTLESQGAFSVSSHFQGGDAFAFILDQKPALVILDVMLPGTNGLEVLRELRTAPGLETLPVILLTARSLESDRIEGFEHGADDYITKPFSPKELLLRVQALFRRTQGWPQGETLPATKAVEKLASEKSIKVGPVFIYPELYRVEVNGQHVPLTSTEFQLLLFLAERPGRLQSRELLLQRVWGYEGNVNTRTVDTHIKRLRQKLGAAGNVISTVHGFGYQVLVDEA